MAAPGLYSRGEAEWLVHGDSFLRKTCGLASGAAAGMTCNVGRQHAWLRANRSLTMLGMTNDR